MILWNLSDVPLNRMQCMKPLSSRFTGTVAPLVSLNSVQNRGPALYTSFFALSARFYSRGWVYSRRGRWIGRRTKREPCLSSIQTVSDDLCKQGWEPRGRSDAWVATTTWFESSSPANNPGFGTSNTIDTLPSALRLHLPVSFLR